MDIQFDPIEHRYWLDGQEVPSVTRILEALKVSDNAWVKEEYRQRGTAVHKICDLIDEGTSDRDFDSTDALIDASQWSVEATTPALAGYGMAYASFRVKSKFRPVLVEQKVAHPGYRYAGILDRFGTFPGQAKEKGSLLDIKSGEPGVAARLQTALYQRGLENNFPLLVELRAALQLFADGDSKLHRYTDNQDIQVGLSAVTFYHWMRNHKLL